MSSVARHERCNTFSTCRVFLIHLEIPCCIYIIFLFKIYTYCCVFCYTSSWCDVFSNTFTSGFTFFWNFLKRKKIWKKNTSTSGCIEKYISLVKMYKKIRNRKLYVKKKIIVYIALRRRRRYTLHSVRWYNIAIPVALSFKFNF